MMMVMQLTHSHTDTLQQTIASMPTKEKKNIFCFSFYYLLIKIVLNHCEKEKRMKLWSHQNSDRSENINFERQRL